MPGQYNPESILEEQFESQRQQIQKQFQLQWDDVNRQARDNLFKSPKDHEAALHDLYTQNKQIMLKFNQQTEQATGQLQQIDRLAEMGAIQNPDEVKWRLVMGPEAERAMFPPEPRDPRLEHQRNLAEQNRIMDTTDAFIKEGGKLYKAKTEKINNIDYYTDKADKSKPATPEEIRSWVMSSDALFALEQQEEDIIGQISGMGVPDPARFQKLYTEERRKSFFKKYIYGLSGPGLIHKSVKRIRAEFGAEPTGTFAQKVQQDIAPSLTQTRTQQPRTAKPQTGKKLTKKIAMQYLMQYGNQQDAIAASAADGYTE